jgi:two-component system sensor histidine kinase UhpB
VKNVKEWWDMNIHPEDRSKVNDAFEAAFLKKRTTVQIEYRYRCADGSYKYIFDRAFIIYNNKKEPERMIGSMQDMTKEKEFAIKVEKAVIEAQEREWNQIGMELHDNVNQILAASLLYMGFGVEKIKKGQKAYEEIRESEKHVREAISEIRKLSHQLAPVSDNEISLKQVFESLIETINVNNRFEIKLEVSDMDDIQITDEQQINLYRILQEQLNNIVKHADASEVVVSLTRSGSSLVFSIRDNGKGFDPEMQATGIGLENIKRRAKVFSGVFRLNTSLGKGCEVVVEIPAKVLSQV